MNLQAAQERVGNGELTADVGGQARDDGRANSNPVPDDVPWRAKERRMHGFEHRGDGHPSGQEVRIVVLDALVKGFVPTGLQCLGAAIVVAGLLLSQWVPKTRPRHRGKTPHVAHATQA